MKISLCAINSKYIHSTLAVWYLAASLEKHSPKTEYAVVEGTINEKEELIYGRLLETKADIIAFSTYIWNKKIVLSLAEKLKNELGCKILLGGPEVSYNVKEIFDKYPFVDYIISGEGEEPISKLCNEEATEKIEGLCYKKGVDVVVKPPCLSKNDPPNPYTGKYLEALKGRISYIETSRGCPFKCAFCLSGRQEGVRFFDLEQSKEKILLLANSGTQTVKFIDRTFNADRKRARDIFRFIIDEREKRIPLGVCFHFEIEGELLDDETVELLKTAPAGLFQFEIGLQSFNKSTLNSINRKANLNRLCDRIKSVIDLGNIHTHIDLIIGLPKENLESFRKSFNRAYALKPHMLQLGFLKLLHGADLRKDKSYDGAFIDTPPYEIKLTPWISEDEIQRLHSLEDVFEKMYNSSRFTLTCDYLDSLYSDAFEMYSRFSDYVTATEHQNTLDSFTKLIFDFFGGEEGVSKALLRDKLALDRLASNRMGALPDFLKVKCPKMKKYLAELERDVNTKKQKNIKRAATLLLSENKLAYVDYDRAGYLTNRFLLKFTEIFDN